MGKEKMVKHAKVLDTVFKILQIVIIICVSLCVSVMGIFTVVNIINPGSAAEAGFNLVHIGPLALELAEGTEPSGSTALVYVWVMMTAVIAIAAIVCFAIHIIRKILAPMTQGDPFHPTVGKEFKRLAFASLAIGIIQNIMNVAEALSVSSILDSNSLLQSSQIQAVTTNYAFDLGFIVVFFALLLMSHIFKYGEELQKLSDETL